MQTSTAYRRMLLSFLVGVALGFVLAGDPATFFRPAPVIVPIKRVDRQLELQATILRCPVSTAGIQEWHNVCRAKRRSEGVR